jgi:hypothetical protein
MTLMLLNGNKIENFRKNSGFTLEIKNTHPTIRLLNIMYYSMYGMVCRFVALSNLPWGHPCL